MDMSDKLEVDKRREDSANYHHTSPVPPDWSNFSTSSSIRMISEGNPIGPSHSSMGSIVNSFVPPIWDQPSSAPSLGYSGVNLQNVASFPDTLVQTREFPSSLRSGLDNSGWDALNSMLKGGLVLPNVSTALPHSLSQFPADSAFIERAARFSCFSTNIADTANPFGIHQSAASPYSHGGVNIPPGTQEVFPEHVTEAGCGAQPSKHGKTNQALAEQDVPLGIETGNKLEAERRTEGFDDECKPDDSDEAETAGGEEEELSLMDTATEPSSSKRPGSKKRQRGGRDSEMDQNQEQLVEAGKDTGGKLSCSPPSTKNNSGRNGKQISQSSDKSKGEYIHVRARRGQATNSHSLAERVRREKISERMKFLQDLVPGCSKVTGKAVMLDEIINYVQSLQRQVEFLSMKLATVNPRLDFNIESLLAKDSMLCARAGPSQLGFSPDTMHITYPPMHPPQQSLVQAGLPPIVPSPSDALRNMSPQLMGVSTGYKEPASQLPNVWDDDDLQNVVHMGLNQTAANTGGDGADTNGSLQSGRMKAEH